MGPGNCHIKPTLLAYVCVVYCAILQDPNSTVDVVWEQGKIHRGWDIVAVGFRNILLVFKHKVCII